MATKAGMPGARRSSLGLRALCSLAILAIVAKLAAHPAFTPTPTDRVPAAPQGQTAGPKERVKVVMRAAGGASACLMILCMLLPKRGADGGESEAVEVPRNRAVQVWGTFGVCAYLGYGVQKVVPIVMEGVGAIEAPWQWGLLAVTVLFFAYVEGYKGFQKGFSPRVVSRAWIVSEETSNAPFWHKLLAPAFCIGYFHGTLKRVLTSWGVTSVIFAVVVGVKQLANPYRAIIDAGVIIGLVWGIVSIVALFIQAIRDDKPPDFDPALPEDTPYTKPTLKES